MSGLANFYSRTRDARKIIVVDLGFLGDTVQLVPALWEIKGNYPQAQLHVVTSPVGAEVLRMAPCVDRTWVVERRRYRNDFAEQWARIRAWRRERFDIAFNFSGADRTLYLTALSGARWRVGHRGGMRWHFYSRWLIPEWAPRQDPDLIVHEQRRRVLAACGLKLGPVRFDLRLDPDAVTWAARVVPDVAIHVSPNASKVTKEWPLDHYAAMLRNVWEAIPEVRVLATSGDMPRERERLHALAEMMKDPRLELLPLGLSIAQVSAMLARCRLHVGADSGVLHLAVVLNVPTVSMFREQGAYKSFMPSGPLHRVITMPCHCIDGRNAPCEQLGRAECFSQITPARVALLVKEQLAASLKKR